MRKADENSNQTISSAMSSVWLRQSIGRLSWLVLAGTGTCVFAGESLPPLRVDPTLLGGAPLKPQQPAPTSQTAATQAAPATSTPDAAPLPRSEAQVEPVAPPPASRDLTPITTERTAAPAVALPASVPAASQPLNPPTKPTAIAPLAKNLPPLRVDPALLGGAPLPAVAVATQPPQVADQPSLPPLYSAHVAAGVFPHPATTAFSNVSKDAAPTLISARNLKGVNELEAIAEGDAVLQRAGDSLHADRIVYRQTEDELEAIGNVRLVAPDSLITGPRLRMRMEESTGEFESPSYTIRNIPAPVPEPAVTMSGLPAITSDGQVLASTGRMLQPPAVTGSGSADLIEFRGEDQYRLTNATYSTCAPGRRDWEISVDSLDLDYEKDMGKARQAVVKFMDVPILYSPWMSFPLSNQRNSGFLSPTIGSTSKSGFQVATPWYWNIAPNMDATITPSVLSKRGALLNTEFRYLDYMYSGLARVEYLPDDKLTKRDRYSYAFMHAQNLGRGFSLGLNLNRVSDDNYLSDLSTRLGSVTQGNLLRQGTLSYGGAWYSAVLNVQSYQTLQGLAKPYQRLPQLTVAANRYDLPLGLTFNFSGEYVNFDHPTNVVAKRTMAYPQISLPITTSAFWITPKLGIHHTSYQLEGRNRPAAAAWAAVPADQSRSVPIFSVDGGFIMERETEIFGNSLTQTLEPRAYYVNIPDKDKVILPQVFDTALAGFNYANMFRENRYAGNDRVGDANEVTLAVTSRFLDAVGGRELLRGTLGTRYYFDTQKIVLPGEIARSERKADVLAALTGQVLPKTYADVGWQYNPRDSRTEQMTVGGRYRPAAGKIFNASYRFRRDATSTLGNNKQIDLSAQWPLSGGWHGVGRYNYSITEKRLIESIGGVEYNAGCWVGRFVVQRLATIAQKPTTAIFFQLELNDFSKIGSNPLDILKRNVPGYGVINQPTADPVFAEN